jgi:hypothetical protein
MNLKTPQSDDRLLTGQAGDNDRNIFRERDRTDVAGNVSTPPQTQPPTSTIPAQADPSNVAPSTVSGSLGDPTDGTQVPHHVPTAVPGKPMAPIGTAEGGVDDITPTLDTPNGPHAERGGTG